MICFIYFLRLQHNAEEILCLTDSKDMLSPKIIEKVVQIKNKLVSLTGNFYLVEMLDSHLIPSLIYCSTNRNLYIKCEINNLIYLTIIINLYLLFYFYLSQPPS